MKSIINSIGSRVAVFALAAALLVGGAGTANAQSVADLQAQINALLAQIAALQGGSTVVATTFTADLTIGSTGAQVTALQNFLIQKGYSIPAGATGYFGVQTQSALAAFQAAQGISPAAGYFGPITRARVNSMTTVTTPPTQGGGTTTTLRGGEASLERYRVSNGNDSDAEEGSSAEVAEIEFRVEDGDVRIDRLDLTFEPAVGNNEDEPWDVFDTVTLYDEDGDELASENVSDEDDWLDDDEPYVFRFTNLGYVVREGDSAHITVEVEVQNGAVASGSNDRWTLYVDDNGIRATDAEGLTQETGDENETVTFGLDEEGEGEELTIRSSSEDPDASTIQVEDDRRSDWYTIFAFELEAEESDIELDQLPIDLRTGTADAEDVVDDIRLVIDGDTFDDFSWDGTGTFASTTFDIDGDYTVDEGDRVLVEVEARFKSANGVNYNPGETIRASVNGTNIEAEGSDDLNADGSATGDTHTLEVSGITVSQQGRSAQTTNVDGADNDYATFTIEADVTALEQDVFIPVNAASAFTFEIQDASTGAVIGTSTATTSSVTSNAPTQGDYYRINENQTREFIFSVTYNPLPENESRNYRMRLLTIEFNDVADTPDQSWNALPASTYQTSSTYIND